MKKSSFADGKAPTDYMADSKFTKGQERAFWKLKKSIKDSEDVVYASPPKKKK